VKDRIELNTCFRIYGFLCKLRMNDRFIIFSHLVSKLCLQWCQWLRRRRRFRLHLYNNVEIIFDNSCLKLYWIIQRHNCSLPTLNLTKLETKNVRSLTCGFSSTDTWIQSILLNPSIEMILTRTVRWILRYSSKHALLPAIWFG
jgi:hypothetical protein